MGHKSFKSEKDKFKYVYFRIAEEGMDYTFNDYSEFLEIEDKRFHELRLAYLAAGNELQKYIVDKTGLLDEGDGINPIVM